MSDKQWTPAQQSAIEDEGGTLLVSAAAGSGKTAVLVERAVRLVTRENNPVPADRLLIVTFTNAAAEELRSRIGARIEQELCRRPGSPLLRRQRILLRRAAICTIDAFCQQLVKENFARLSVPPDVAVGEEGLLNQLAEAALAETMEEMYARPAFAAFASLYGRSRSDKAAADAILNLYGFTRTLPAPARQLAGFAAMYQSGVPLAQTLWGKELLAYGQSAAGAMQRLLTLALQTARQDDALAPYLPALTDDLENARRLGGFAEKNDWDGAVRQLAAWQFAPLRPVRGYEGGGKEQVKQLRDTVKDLAARLQKYCFACTLQEYEADVQQAAPMVEALTGAAALYGEKYHAAKLAEKVLDFADFEHLALSLLQTEEGQRTALAGQISRRYEAVMVDEYQDTNELQSALYECLGNAEGSNLFYVGDVKQSIYRFRKANPGIFLAKKRQWAPFAPGGERPAVLTLGHNFRSGRGVIGGVNYLFSALMSPALGEIEYSGEELLIQGTEGGEEQGLELRLVEDPGGRGDAAYVAGRIREMLRQQYPVRTQGGTRPCAPGDFCILLRARARMQEYLAALEDLNIPAVADGAEDLLQTPEVLPVCAALAAIDNPGDDVNLAATLLGPLFRFSPNEVTEIRAASPKGSLWGALAASGSPKAGQFMQTISFYRALAGEVPVGRLCEELVERTAYLSAVAAMENGAARRENLLRFIAWAAEASAGGRGGLAGFVRLLQSGHGPAAPAAGSVPGRVNILSIHKSKGLEFPVCFLADAARVFNTSDLGARVQMHAQLGVGLALRSGESLYATLPALAIRRRIEQEAQSEEMRVLYVALTRAKDKMVITLPHKAPAEYVAARAAALAGGEPEAFLLSTQRSFGDWVTTAALCHPDADPLLQYTGGAILPCLAAEGRFAMGIEQQPAAEGEGARQYRLTAAPLPGLVKQLQTGFETVFPRSGLQTVPVKLSVSALAKQGGQTLRARPSFMYAGGLTAAELGTAQHSFMQFADYRSARQNLEEEIQRLVRQGHLAAEEAETLNRQRIEAFLASPLMGRMEKAGRVLREYDFITAVPAGQVQPGLPGALAEEPVLVQGIADALLLFENAAEIVDYKTDRGKTAEELVQTYQRQLQLYREAIQKRLAVPVKKLTIWAFSLDKEIDVT
ncbi:MAG: UvrD-helicase domain-containing protein [Oscillospiraceae bacterium]